MTDDITFCARFDCVNKSCFRHANNIRVHNIPHSFADFYHTVECHGTKDAGKMPEFKTE